MSEAKRGLIRIVTNYARLACFLGVTIIMAPLLLGGIGEDLYGVWALIVGVAGIGEMIRTILLRSLLREVGTAYHSKDPKQLDSTYAAAWGFSLLAAIPAAIIYITLWLLIPKMGVPAEYIDAARMLIIIKGIQVTTMVATAAPRSIITVKEMFVFANFVQALDRLGMLAAAIFVFLILGLGGDPQDLTASINAFEALVWATTAMAFAVLTYNTIVASRHIPFLPARGAMTRAGIRDIAATGGWNTLAVSAMSMHQRIAMVIMMFVFGPQASAIYELSNRLSGYIHVLSQGISAGIEAVSTRVSSAKDSAKKDHAALIHHSTRILGMVALPGAAGVILLTQPLLTLWVGKHLSPENLAATIIMTRVMAIAALCNAISDSWSRILYGAGAVKPYAKLFFLGGLLSPCLSIIFIAIFPTNLSIYGPAAAFALILLAVHLLTLPIIVAKEMGMTYAEVLIKPLVKPFLATCITAPALLTYHLDIPIHPALKLLGASAAFGAAFTAAAWLFILDRAERTRILAFALRTVRRRKTAATA